MDKAIVEGESAAENSGKAKEKEKVERGQVSDPVVGEKAIAHSRRVQAVPGQAGGGSFL